MTLIRIRHAHGVLKMELSGDVTALGLYERVAEQLGPLYPDASTFWLARDPSKPEESRVVPSDAVTPLVLHHGDLFYLHLGKGDGAGLKNPYGSTGADGEGRGMNANDLDAQLQSENGRIKRLRDERLCKHGLMGMCAHCQPLEPYDQEHLERQGIKHLSFYAWLKKLRDTSNAAVPVSSLLETPSYRVDPKCPFHAPFPAGICTKCQPSAIVLRQQPFRMVDHVEIASGRLVDDFLAGWRQSGMQRFGWLVGRYVSHAEHVPLGIKAVVEHIYEPPQDGRMDGFQLLDDGVIDARHCDLFERLGLQIVGMIYTDLIDDGSGEGRVEHRRSASSFFVSSPEILFMAREQARHPCTITFRQPTPTRVTFSSRFVTVVVSGEADGGIGLKAYQVSESAVAMEEAQLVAATTDPARMLVRTADPAGPLYVPQVFYKFRNEYGIDVQRPADPFFPVDYLLVTLSEGIPLIPAPLFASPVSFPPPHLHPTAATLAEYLGDHLQMSAETLAASHVLSNANLLMHLATAGLLGGETERTVLCEALVQSDPAALTTFISSSETWQRILAAVAEAIVERSSPRVASASWACRHCTFVNTSPQTADVVCEMCSLPPQ